MSPPATPSAKPSPQHLVLLSTALRVQGAEPAGQAAGLRGQSARRRVARLCTTSGLAITSMLDLEELSEGILLRAVSLLDARQGGALFRFSDGSASSSGVPSAVSAVPSSLAANDEVPWQRCLLDGEAVGEQDDPARSEIPRGGCRSRGRVKAVVSSSWPTRRVEPGSGRSCAKRSNAPWSLFANQASIALENARLHREALEKQRLEREMELAAEIQKRLLPTIIPEMRDFEMLGWSRPAQ